MHIQGYEGDIAEVYSTDAQPLFRRQTGLATDHARQRHATSGISGAATGHIPATRNE
jgi:hypothetical protein